MGFRLTNIISIDYKTSLTLVKSFIESQIPHSELKSHY